MDLANLTDDQLRDLLADLDRYEESPDFYEPGAPTGEAADRELLRWLAGMELETREQHAALIAGGY